MQLQLIHKGSALDNQTKNKKPSCL